MKLTALKRTCVSIGGVDTWYNAGDEFEATAEEFAMIESMGYVGEYIVVVSVLDPTKKKKEVADA